MAPTNRAEVDKKWGESDWFSRESTPCSRKESTMSSYSVSSTTLAAPAAATLLRLSFGSPAQNDQIVRDAVAALEDCKLEGGKLVLLNGPASLPVACALAHRLAHIFGAIGVFDPKMAGYVVAVSHDPTYLVGMVIPASEVKEG